MGSQCRLLGVFFGVFGIVASRRFRDGVGMLNRIWIDNGRGSRVYFERHEFDTVGT